MRNRPLVSVVIGAYNAERYLAEAIDSVLRQTYRPIELVVVDDGSDDRTADVARSYGDRVRYRHQRNAGNGAARNTGVQASTGGLLAFLDADDRFTPEKLDLQWQALASDEIEAVFGHVREFVSPELTDEERGRVRPPAPAPLPWTAPNLMLIRRASFLRVGPFSESLRVGVTVDWFARATEAGLRTTMLSQVVLERRLHTQNNGLRERESRAQYAHVLKAALDRRRLAATTTGAAGSGAAAL